MNEIQAAQIKQVLPGSCNLPICQDVADVTNWEDRLVWDLNGVLYLRRLLASWAECKVPASDIGLFLVKILHGRDDHLDNRLTRMVNLNETYTNIALAILKHYQIRDEDDQPIWASLDLGESELRPKTRPVSESSTVPTAPTATIVPINAPLADKASHMASASPDPMPRWPFYLAGAELEDFFLNNTSETPHGETCHRLSFTNLAASCTANSTDELKLP